LKVQLADIQIELEHGNITTERRNELLREQATLQARIKTLTELPKAEKEKKEKEPKEEKDLQDRLQRAMEIQSKELNEMAKKQMKAYNDGLVEASVAAREIQRLMAQAADPEELEALKNSYDDIWETEAKRANERRGQRAKETEDWQKGSEKVASQEQKDVEQTVVAAQRLGDALVGAFARGDKGAQEVLKVLNAMASVAMMIAILETPGAAASSIIGGIAGAISGIGKLFQTGGYTGSGAASEPAGMVHRGEIVFEKPIVDKYGPELMRIRSLMQTPVNLKEIRDMDRLMSRVGGIISRGSPSAGDTRTVAEIRGLRSEIAGLKTHISSIAEAIGNMPPPVAQFNNPVVITDELENEWPKQMAKYNAKLS
jgi:hypothetical protein